MRKTRRSISYLALVLGSASVMLGAEPREAQASVGIKASLEDLARGSSVIVRATALDASSAWEGGRIVTTTRLRVVDVIAGVSSREVRVRTLGGRVGVIGQHVEGEAVFTPSEPAVLFLRPSGETAFVVAGRAQGQMLIRRDTHGREIVRFGNVGVLVARPTQPPLVAAGKPITELEGAPLANVTLEAKRAWEASHAK